MVAVRSHEADKFLRGRTDHIVLFLFFGADSGLVSERARTVARGSVSDPRDPFQLVRLDGDAIAADPALLSDETNTIGLFGGRRAIWVDVGSKNIAPACEAVLTDRPIDCTIILEAGALKRDNALRRLVEQDRSAVAVECNPDDGPALQAMVDEMIRTQDLSITSDARERLVSLVGEDRLSTRAEVQKLLLFAYGTGTIDLHAVETLVADASTLDVESAIEAAFSGRMDYIEEILARYFSGGGDPGVLIGQALRHGMILHRVKLLTSGGMPVETALERSARVPFHVRRTMAGQVRGWQTERLLKAIEGLAEGVRRSRREARLAPQIATRVLWSVALGARSK